VEKRESWGNKHKKRRNMSEVKVEKISIKIGDKEQEYTLEEAKELQKLLNELFGNKETIYISVPAWQVDKVIYREPTYPYPYTSPTTVPYPGSNPWIITCGTDTTNSSGLTCIYTNKI
jgi:hypothetical protein